MYELPRRQCELAKRVVVAVRALVNPFLATPTTCPNAFKPILRLCSDWESQFVRPDYDREVTEVPTVATRLKRQHVPSQRAQSARDDKTADSSPPRRPTRGAAKEEAPDSAESPHRKRIKAEADKTHDGVVAENQALRLRNAELAGCNTTLLNSLADAKTTSKEHKNCAKNLAVTERARDRALADLAQAENAHSELRSELQATKAELARNHEVRHFTTANQLFHYFIVTHTHVTHTRDTHAHVTHTRDTHTRDTHAHVTHTRDTHT